MSKADCEDGSGRVAQARQPSPSWHATAHVIETVFTILGVFVAVFALAWAFKKSERWRDLWIATLASGIAALASMLLVCSEKVSGPGSRRRQR